MTCRKTQASLSAYIDGELGGQEMLRVRKHLQQCQACAAEAEVLRFAQQLLADMPCPEVPIGLEDRLVNHVFAGTGSLQKRSTWRTWAMSSTVAAAAVALGLVAWTVSHGAPQRQSDPATLAQSVDQNEAYFAGGDPVSPHAPVFSVSDAP
ncbi:MAG: zf-HC2 domain-containing protein [Armatimonadetes bacterium]|nr:zf-HC2 domain-containing protein [Armatimonadota bacterium]